MSPSRAPRNDITHSNAKHSIFIFIRFFFPTNCNFRVRSISRRHGAESRDALAQPQQLSESLFFFPNHRPFEHHFLMLYRTKTQAKHIPRGAGSPVASELSCLGALLIPLQDLPGSACAIQGLQVKFNSKNPPIFNQYPSITRKIKACFLPLPSVQGNYWLTLCF